MIQLIDGLPPLDILHEIIDNVTIHKNASVNMMASDVDASDEYANCVCQEKMNENVNASQAWDE